MSEKNEIRMMKELTPNQYILLKYFEIKGVKNWTNVYETIGMSKNTYYKCKNVLESKGLV